MASAALVALLAGPLAAGRALATQDLGAMTNAERVSRGLRALSTASDLQSLAQQRANQMAQSGVLAHTVNLSSKVSGWQKIGENVGRGPALSDIETAFMNSPEHRDNILDPAFT
ncbi:MAG TPA: CAP domain-containing protein, partial [Acidimicrobiia bacterium]|nr:CAP domain-containing protein [Acidimicrobiia bacterium]